MFGAEGYISSQKAQVISSYFIFITVVLIQLFFMVPTLHLAEYFNTVPSLAYSQSPFSDEPFQAF